MGKSGEKNQARKGGTQSWLVAVAILLLIIAGVVWNAVWIHRTVDTLTAELSELPAFPDAEQTPTAVAAVQAQFEARLPLLQITVQDAELDRIREAFVTLKVRAESGDAEGYAVSLAVLRTRIAALKSFETWACGNLF